MLQAGQIPGRDLRPGKERCCSTNFKPFTAVFASVEYSILTKVSLVLVYHLLNSRSIIYLLNYNLSPL